LDPPLEKSGLSLLFKDVSRGVDANFDFGKFPLSLKSPLRIPTARSRCSPTFEKTFICESICRYEEMFPLSPLSSPLKSGHKTTLALDPFVFLDVFAKLSGRQAARKRLDIKIKRYTAYRGSVFERVCCLRRDHSDGSTFSENLSLRYPQESTSLSPRQPKRGKSLDAQVPYAKAKVSKRSPT